MTVKSISKTIIPILKKYQVKQASIFGSHARGEANKNSDLDLLVKLPAKTTLLKLVSLQLSLEDKLGKKVDIVTHGSLYPRLRQYIEKDSQKIL